MSEVIISGPVEAGEKEKKRMGRPPKAKVENVQRPIAPEVRVTRPYNFADNRSRILQDLDEQDSDYKHMYQTPEIFGANASRYEMELAGKGQEVVRNSKGDVVNHMGDPVVRVHRSVWEAKLKGESEFAEQQASTVVNEGEMTVFRKAKTPKDAKGDRK